MLDNVDKGLIIDLMNHIDNVLWPCLNTDCRQNKDQEVKNKGTNKGLRQVLEENITWNTTDSLIVECKLLKMCILTVTFSPSLLLFGCIGTSSFDKRLVHDKELQRFPNSFQDQDSYYSAQMKCHIWNIVKSSDRCDENCECWTLSEAINMKWQLLSLRRNKTLYPFTLKLRSLFCINRNLWLLLCIIWIMDIKQTHQRWPLLLSVIIRDGMKPC